MMGRASDELPVCPRLDLWYNANKHRGTLPEKYRNASLYDISADLDIGYNTTIPNFRSLEDPAEEAFRALGLFQCADIFYEVSFDVEVKIRFEGDNLVTEFITPHGNIRVCSVYNERMKQDGVTISHVAETAFKSESDYAALCYVFEHAVVTPRFERIAQLRETAGERGDPIAWVSSAASPMHYVQKQLMGFEQFFYELFDHPDELAELCESIGVMENKIFEVMLEAPVHVYRIGGNFDSMIQNPPFFEEHIAPFLKNRSDALHARGKILLTHTDGENDGLLDLYLDSGIDVAESFCPAPMTRISVIEARGVFGDSVCLWGGIPSLMVLRDSYSDRDYDAYLDEFFEAIGDGRRLIISIADTVPPEADFTRIETLVRRAKDFGSVPGVTA